jgi:hypothetical protein
VRGQAAYESLRELEFGISQKGNSRSGQQLLSVNVALSMPNLTKEKHFLYRTVFLLNSGGFDSPQEFRDFLFTILSPGLSNTDVAGGGKGNWCGKMVG